MFYSGSTNLTWSKKREQYENSTRSCRIQESGNYWIAYSYGQILAWYDKKQKCYIYNNRKFSITTSSHQGAIVEFLQKNKLKYIVCETYKNTTSNLVYLDLTVCLSNVPVVKNLFKSRMKHFAKSLESEEKKEKEIKALDSLRRRIVNVQFKTYSGYSKAYEKFSEARVRLNLTVDKITKILELKDAPRSAISEHLYLLPSYYFRPAWGKKEDYFKTFSTLDKNDLLYLVDFEHQNEETKIILDEYKALKNLGDLI